MINEAESVGLDKIPNKLFRKMATDMIAPSLTEIFAKSIHVGLNRMKAREQGSRQCIRMV